MTSPSLYESMLHLAQQLSSCYRKAAIAALRGCEALIRRRSVLKGEDAAQWRSTLRNAIHRTDLSRRVRNNYCSGVDRVLALSVGSGLISSAPVVDRLGYPEITSDLAFAAGKRCYDLLVDWAVNRKICYDDLETDHLLKFKTHLTKRYEADTVRHYRSGLKAFWNEAVHKGLLREISFPSGPIRSDRKSIGLPYPKWPEEAKEMWSSVTRRCRDKADFSKEPWPVSWAEDSLRTYQRQIEIYLGYLTVTRKIEDKGKRLRDWLADVKSVQACLERLESLQPGRYHDRYYLPYICSILLRHYYKDNDAAERVDKIKAKRHFPPPKTPGDLAVTLEEFQAARSKLVQEIEDLSSSKHATLEVVAQASDKMLMFFLMTRPVRQRNLHQLEFGKHLITDSTGNWYLNIPEYQVKNGECIHHKLPVDLGRSLDAFQALRTRAGLDLIDQVFLNMRGKQASKMTLRSRVKDLSIQIFGIDLSPHAYRGAMVSAYTAKEPGNFAAAQTLLGHTSMTTTLRYYITPDAETTRRRVKDWLETHPSLVGLKALAQDVSGLRVAENI